MSECFLSRRGQGHVSNFYIVDLENFETASPRYTGDIIAGVSSGLLTCVFSVGDRLPSIKDRAGGMASAK